MLGDQTLVREIVADVRENPQPRHDMKNIAPQCDRNNYSVRSRNRLALIAAIVLSTSVSLLPPPATAADVLTQHNDQWRTGSNLSETALTPSNVNVNNFGKLFSYTVDGHVYAQPLLVSGLSIAGGTHNVCYIATMEDSVYAFDADSNTTFWHVVFTGGNITPVPIVDITGNNNLNIHGDVGILSTPVIDRASGTIYVLARTKDTSNSTYIQKLHALNILTGAEKFGGPVTIAASGFNTKLQSQRPGLGLSNGNVYIAWGSHEDINTYHGWAMAYNATTLAQVAVFNSTPGGSRGAFWQAGQAPAFDRTGNLYMITGNGDWNGTTNWGETFLKLTPTLGVLDWFTPDNFASLNSGDVDFGSAGALLLPTASGYPSTQYVIGGGKEGKIFVLDKSGSGTMGHESSGNTGAHQIWQAIQTAACSHHIHGSPVYWNSSTQGQLVYVWGENDVGKAFKFNGSTFTTTAFSTTTVKAPTTGCGMPGATLSISANGNTNGIIWANCVFTGDALHNIVPGILRAYNANSLGTELWNSQMNSTRDGIGLFAKYVPPTVANGKVYMSSFSNRVHVYGPLSGVVSPGTYKLVNRATGKALDDLGATADGASVGQWTIGNTDNQRWVVTLSGGNYKLSCVGNSKFLDSLGNTADASPVGMWASSSSANQQWSISDAGSGFVKLTNVANGKCLDSAGAITNGAIMQFQPSGSSTNQQWQLTAP
jgi:Ricin-type beta-trefoil lectin domain